MAQSVKKKLLKQDLFGLMSLYALHEKSRAIQSFDEIRNKYTTCNGKPPTFENIFKDELALDTKKSIKEVKEELDNLVDSLIQKIY